MTVHVGEKARRAAELLLAIKAVACDPPRVDVRKLISFVDERREIVWLMAAAVRDQAFDAVAGGAYGAWVAELAGLPLLQAGDRIEGELKPGQKVLLVDDRDGGSMLGALRALRGAGAVCEHAVVVLYDGSSPQVLQDAGIVLHATTTWRHLIDAAQTFKYFSPEQIKGIQAHGVI
jgi:orotate phosphoribosyltransferase